MKKTNNEKITPILIKRSFLRIVCTLLILGLLLGSLSLFLNCGEDPDTGEVVSTPSNPSDNKNSKPITISFSNFTIEITNFFLLVDGESINATSPLVSKDTSEVSVFIALATDSDIDTFLNVSLLLVNNDQERRTVFEETVAFQSNINLLIPSIALGEEKEYDFLLLLESGSEQFEISLLSTVLAPQITLADSKGILFPALEVQTLGFFSRTNYLFFDMDLLVFPDGREYFITSLLENSILAGCNPNPIPGSCWFGLIVTNTLTTHFVEDSFNGDSFPQEDYPNQKMEFTTGGKFWLDFPNFPKHTQSIWEHQSSSIGSEWFDVFYIEPPIGGITNIALYYPPYRYTNIYRETYVEDIVSGNNRTDFFNLTYFVGNLILNVYDQADLTTLVSANSAILYTDEVYIKDTAIIDLNDDGAKDLMLLTSANELVWFLNQNEVVPFHFTNPNTVPLDWDIAIDKINSLEYNGKSGFATLYYNEEDLQIGQYVYQNNEVYPVILKSVSLTGELLDFVVLDIDSDNDDDIVIVTTDAVHFFLQQENSSGRKKIVEEVANFPDGYDAEQGDHKFVFHDFNKNGIMDIVRISLSEQQNCAVDLFLNDGHEDIHALKSFSFTIDSLSSLERVHVVDRASEGVELLIQTRYKIGSFEETEYLKKKHWQKTYSLKIN